MKQGKEGQPDSLNVRAATGDYREDERSFLLELADRPRGSMAVKHSVELWFNFWLNNGHPGTLVGTWDTRKGGDGGYLHLTEQAARDIVEALTAVLDRKEGDWTYRNTAGHAIGIFNGPGHLVCEIISDHDQPTPLERQHANLIVTAVNAFYQRIWSGSDGDKIAALKLAHSALDGDDYAKGRELHEALTAMVAAFGGAK